jgi:hypothetical protein
MVVIEEAKSDAELLDRLIASTRSLRQRGDEPVEHRWNTFLRTG